MDASITDPWSPAARAAVARFDPRPTALRRLAARAVAGLSRGLMRWGNQVEVEGAGRLVAAREEARRLGRGLLTLSNHVSLFDDPWLTSLLSEPDWERMRWVAADALNFFGTAWKAAVFNAGKCVPVVRGAGRQQPGMDFLAGRLVAGDWVHVFPEGGRSRDPEARLRCPLKPGLAALVEAARPLLLPWSHAGMEKVLPVGARWPRLGQRVRVLVGELVDSAEGLADGPGEAVMAWAEERLTDLQARLRPELALAGPPVDSPAVGS